MKKISLLHRALIASAILLNADLSGLLAQNTIGGVKKEVPEAEVERQTRFLDAESFRMLGKYDKAIEAYKKFLYNNETADAAWYGLARSYSETKDYGNALDAIDKAILNAPDNKWYYIHKADIFEKNAQIAQAADVYEQLAKKNPKTPEFLERLAYLSILSENPKRGLKALDQLENLTGISEITASKKHLVYVALGDHNKAANELRRLCDAYPNQLDYKRSLAKFYHEIGDIQAEKGVWNDILRQNPNDAEARLGALEKGKNSDEAARLDAMLPLFKDPTVGIDAKIKEIAPYLSKLDKNTAPSTINALLALGEALESLHKDDAKAWSVSGDLFYLLDRNKEALERYRKCIALRPRTFSVWENALAILEQQGDYASMFTLSEQAMDAFPNQPKGYYWNGLSANQLKKFTDAQAVLEQAVFMSGNNAVLMVEVADQLGLSLLGQQKPDDALACYDKVMAKGGDKNPALLEHYGDVLSAKGERTKAIEWWKKAKNIRSTPALEQKISGQ